MCYRTNTASIYCYEGRQFYKYKVEEIVHFSLYPNYILHALFLLCIYTTILIIDVLANIGEEDFVLAKSVSSIIDIIITNSCQAMH